MTSFLQVLFTKKPSHFRITNKKLTYLIIFLLFLPIMTNNILSDRYQFLLRPIGRLTTLIIITLLTISSNTQIALTLAIIYIFLNTQYSQKSISLSNGDNKKKKS